MRSYLRIAVISAGLVFTGFSHFGVNPLVAQTATPSPSVTPTPVDDDEVLKIDTELVSLLFLAQDKDRKLLTSLKKEDIRILEDGQLQQISSFQRQTDLPLSLAILIDVSVSQERTLPEEKAAAKTFLQDFVRPEKDEVCIISFTGETTLEQGLTNNVSRLGRAIDRVQFTPPLGYIGGGVVVSGAPPTPGSNQAITSSTAIWDAVWVTSEEVLAESPNRTRRAIILVTDGLNSFGNKKLEDAVRAAQKAEAVIYSIGIGDNYLAKLDEESLKSISEQTGGHAFFPRDEDELRRAFDQIQIEMRSQYLIAYEPSNPQIDGSYRKVEVQIANSELSRQKVKITHRQGYFAKTASKK